MTHDFPLNIPASNPTPISTSLKDTYWDTRLIQKYDLTGPRYTSYPTALKFDTSYNQNDWLQATKNINTNTARISLYLHIPFCDTICYYCGCNKIVTANHAHAVRYLEYLKKEIRMKAAEIPDFVEVDLVHFGGGTPTYLSDEQLQELLQTLRDEFRFADDELECAIEIHPQSVNIERLQNLKSMGFNRLSLGIQDFAEDVQRAVNRYNSKEEVQALIQEIRRLKYKSVSVDLIYGLPLQTPVGFANTLNDIIELSPDRISVFNYAHMPKLFKSQRQINAAELPEAHEKLQILHESIETLRTNGYEYIGMDHFAKHNDELHKAQQSGTLHRNFQGYATHNHSVLHAVGVSAISTIENHYTQNVKKLDAYYRLLDDDRLPIEKGYKLNNDDEIRRDVINTLLCQFELNYAEIENRFGIVFKDYFHDTFADLSHLHQDGLITLSDDGFKILNKGRLLARSVCKLFDAHAEQDESLSQRFSRII